MKTLTGRRSQVVVTQNSQPLGNAASIANVKVRKNLIWNVLQGQSRLALGKRFGMFEEIKTYFEEMKESSVFNFSNQSKQTYYKKQVEIALERIKIELVFGVLGIVNMSYQGAGSLKLIALLLDDAWHFLKDYLNKEILDVNHEQILKSILNNKRPDRHFLKPGNLMIHCLCLSKQSFISQDLFFEVLRVWTKSSIYKHLMSRIPLDFESLSIYCEKLYQETGQGGLGPQIIQSRKNTHSKLLDTSSAPSIDPDLGIQTCSSRKFSSFIKRSGKKIIDEEKTQAITQFFTDLNKVMKESYQTKSKFINQSTNSSIDQVYLSWTMIDCAMKTAQHSITPSFLGLLGLMHSGMSTPQTWDDIFESGWEFLKSYFSTWHRYVLEMKHPILLDTTKNEKVEIEWYDVKETIHYLHKLVSNNVCPQRPIWYLVDLWYESIKSDGNTISTNLNVLSPHREMMKYKCIQLDDQ
ncbi:hypothetical protein DFH28DRAFT_953381 [Melampsora americana]|nr:hypothetical protein DFH28DRAFT_953381 [Melampsora americana]